MWGRSTLAARNVLKTIVRKSSDHGGHGGNPGENLPFPITNKYKLTALFCVFFGSGFAAPFLVVRHQLLKQ